MCPIWYQDYAIPVPALSGQNTWSLPFTAVYIDDITIFSPNRIEHIWHVKTVIDRLTRYNILIRADKSLFGQRKVRLLGFVVSGAGVEMDQDKVTVIKNWPKPRTHRQLLRFLGAANYYRQFVPHFSNLSHPLGAVRQQKGPVEWTGDMEKAFTTLKASIADSTLLTYPDDSKKYVVATDESEVGLGA